MTMSTSTDTENPKTDTNKPAESPPISLYEKALRADRLEQFRKICVREFCQTVDRSKLSNPEAFDRVASWDGSYPGPCAFGGTGAAKTRAAWSALGRLWVNQEKTFAWFPVKRLVEKIREAEDKGNVDTFFDAFKRPHVLFVDDLDKINWQFESQASALFAFYDWVYRDNKPCITTTNKPKEWWAEKMGDAFARRLFIDAQFAVKF